MEFGICTLNSIPLRIESSDASEMVSQVLFGETFSVLETHKQWLYVKLAFDGYRGWIDKKQVESITKEQFESFQNSELFLMNELVSFISDKKRLIPLTLGATLPNFKDNQIQINENKFQIDGDVVAYNLNKKQIVETAFMYLNAPYLWGGKTPFGIDCSGFTQMVYKLNGYKLFRDASQQAKQGEVLSFLEESEPGDLAFFDNQEGTITHVGIILANNYIIHASGKVRLDRLDQSGIFNETANRHTHKLRMIKRIF